MAPDERRAALIAATIPLLHEHGLDVSTRQIAHAAGVAEGTIFGVFESKSQLVICSVVKALDPQPTLDAQIGKLRQGLARLIDSYAEGLIDKQEFEPRITRLRQRLTALEQGWGGDIAERMARRAAAWTANGGAPPAAGGTT